MIRRELVCDGYCWLIRPMDWEDSDEPPEQITSIIVEAGESPEQYGWVQICAYEFHSRAEPVWVCPKCAKRHRGRG